MLSYKNIVKDVRFIITVLLPIKLRLMYCQYILRGNINYIDLWNKSLSKFKEKNAIVWRDKKYTYQNLDDYTSRIISWFRGKYDQQKYNRVAIFGENNPVFVSICLALFKIKVTPIIIRPDLSDEELISYLSPHKPDLLICSSEHANKVSKNFVNLFDEFFSYDLDFNFIKDYKIEKKEIHLNTGIFDELFFIGTSATTGTSKACNIKNGPLITFMTAHIRMKKLTSNDTLYTCISLSHGEGFAVTILTGFSLGCTVVLDETFEPDKIINKCVDQGITVLSYCGDIPRQLINANKNKNLPSHIVRIASGHEMLETTWNEFKEVLKIPEIVEYYAGTEGGYFFVNNDKPGAIGFIGPLSKILYPFKIIKIDNNNEIIINNGKPVTCELGEVGELYGHINKKDPLAMMNEYLDEDKTARVLENNLFKKGDCWFKTGELIRHDKDGYIYFIGKKNIVKNLNGIYINPQYIEDKIIANTKLNKCSIHFMNNSNSKLCIVAKIPSESCQDKISLIKDLKRSLSLYETPSYLYISDDRQRTVSHRNVRRDNMLDYNSIKDKLISLEE